LVNNTSTERKTPAQLLPLVTDPPPETLVISPEEKENLMKLAMERAAMIPRGK